MAIDNSVKALARANRIIQAAQLIRDGLLGLQGVAADEATGDVALAAVDFSTTSARHTDGPSLATAASLATVLANFADATGVDGKPLQSGGTSVRAALVKVCAS